VNQSVRLPALVLTLTVACTAASAADTVYKVVQPDGSVVYTDRPPASGRTHSATTFQHAPATPLPESVQRFRADIERRLKSQADAARDLAPGEVRLFTAVWCGYCRSAKAYLQAAGVTFQEYDIDAPEGMEAFVRAGGRAVPLLVTSSARVEGFSEGRYAPVVVATRRR
jgi:glutaredoxin